MTEILTLVPTLVSLFLILDNHRLRLDKRRLKLEIKRARNAFKVIVTKSDLYNLSEMTFPESVYQERLSKKLKKDALNKVKKSNSTPLRSAKKRVLKNK